MQQEKVKYYARFTSSRDDAHSLMPIETDVHCVSKNVSSLFADSTDKSQSFIIIFGMLFISKVQLSLL